MSAPAYKPPTSEIVELRVPADSAFVALLRSTIASLAARCELTVDDIEDLRLAVDEASSLLLPHARVGSYLQSSFTLLGGSLELKVGIDADPVAEIDRSGFAWTVLTALVTDIRVTYEGSKLAITATKLRRLA